VLASFLPSVQRAPSCQESAQGRSICVVARPTGWSGSTSSAPCGPTRRSQLMRPGPAISSPVPHADQSWGRRAQRARRAPRRLSRGRSRASLREERRRRASCRAALREERRRQASCRAALREERRRQASCRAPLREERRRRASCSAAQREERRRRASCRASLRGQLDAALTRAAAVRLHARSRRSFPASAGRSAQESPLRRRPAPRRRRVRRSCPC